MSTTKKVLMLPGDGIGPEVMRQVQRVMDWMAKKRNVNFEITEGLIGGASIDAHNNPLTDETLADAMAADAVLLGAVGGPKWDNLPFDIKPERGLLKIRKEMGLFANLRPALVFDALVGASTLKEDIVKGLDIMILRELTGGIYFGQPRGIEERDGVRFGFNTLVYSEPEVERIARVAFDMAMKRNKRLCSVDKANVLESTVLWREVVERVAKDFPEVEVSHMYVDNASMQLVRNPKQFDVMVTTNMFGDILSDCAAMLTGSLGMLPSASLGAADASGARKALYEPVHGSAPDIAGQDIANPLATILSFAMMLRYSFDMGDDATMIETAVQNVLKGGLRTADIMQPGMAKVSTTVMGESLINELDKIA
ncbi:3-isopropylmalate dehydrogenase [Thalassospira sp. MBR-102]|jgi:3-isopropylmalate dehydrogenase|uniref:3-isopropylmalate dehydrogenase n=3 Tax=Thalassospira TaxID=168934 RepID=A0ABR5Y300_9PROT|nr:MULTISPECIES: 3-isopropylmalate dehydrogenase [Thalassospira]MBL4842185.1 3-isopropylmalate dehydrogenase [Thalassospira sp.]MBR9781348.1 3-isopropylmalate dehydrogenase [Rhodospirillales bacterium]AJD50459.1 3-isopropylmalate dehydrogenase [Thalassospira xiamenensis M-5 = DSM 17429]KEO55768.1 3-isopropylmalate dehydrogenase [Thalassospira permensis NBRC 106175]KZD03667.1 3-isopropylmalate dehydrogenase [Thalassospira xiamenensis]|tara:strand:- start:27581 stop:28684 length:1104 start_codon:yes stop_codon:yes gene_type:complete